MAHGSALCVTTLHPDLPQPAIDDDLRTAVLPALLSKPGLTDAFVGRRVEDAGERVLATIWRSEREASGAEDVAAWPGSRVDRAPVRIAIRPDHREPARILRVFRGEVRPGELDAYVAEVRDGTLADAGSNPGLVALFLGATGPDTFLTVSAWVEWSAIEEATGGDTRRPVATRNSARLTRLAVGHYEILPNAESMVAGVLDTPGR
jgi:hypothetical protein